MATTQQQQQQQPREQAQPRPTEPQQHQQRTASEQTIPSQHAAGGMFGSMIGFVGRLGAALHATDRTVAANQPGSRDGGPDNRNGSGNGAPPLVAPRAAHRMITIDVGGVAFALSCEHLRAMPRLWEQLAPHLSSPSKRPEAGPSSKTDEAPGAKAGESTGGATAAPLTTDGKGRDPDFVVDGDSQAFRAIVSYLRGNRTYLSAFRRSEQWLLRNEAARFGLQALVDDLDWYLNPTASPESTAWAGATADLMWAILRMPFLHEFPAVRVFLQFLVARAAQNGTSAAVEFRGLVHAVASSSEFREMNRSDRLPSIERGHEPPPGDRPPTPPSLYSVVGETLASFAMLGGWQALHAFAAHAFQ